MQTFKKSTTNIQNASISENEKKKMFVTLRKNTLKKCLSILEFYLTKSRLKQFTFLTLYLTVIPITLTKIKREDLLWITAFNNI